MKAVVYTRYGSAEVLGFKELDMPMPKSNELLIKVHATTVNRTDCATIKAKPFFMRIVTGLFRPKKQTPGTEFSGEVTAVGKSIVSFKIGDKVFGFDDSGCKAHAEYLTIKEENVLSMPESISYEQAAGSFEGAHYAYNFINKVKLDKRDDVLVNGSTGAIGSAAVQLLKAYEVNITAVCATKNIDLVKSLGASRVIDYTKEDFTKDDRKYSFVFDAVGKSSFFKCKHLLRSGGVYISSDLGFLSQNIFLPMITPVIKFLLGNKKTIFPTPKNIRESLVLIKDLIEKGQFKALIDKEYSFEQIAEAYAYVEKGHKKGNVIITVAHK